MNLLILSLFFSLESFACPTLNATYKCDAFGGWEVSISTKNEKGVVIYTHAGDYNEDGVLEIDEYRADGKTYPHNLDPTHPATYSVTCAGNTIKTIFKAEGFKDYLGKQITNVELVETVDMGDRLAKYSTSSSVYTDGSTKVGQTIEYYCYKK